MTGSPFDVLWIIAAGVIALAAAMAGRRLREKYRSLASRQAALRDRTESFANYIKLASVRLAESYEMRKDLNARLTSQRKNIEEAKRTSQARRETGQRLFHVFDRVSGRRGHVWAVIVEALNDHGPWTGTRHYVVVAETPEEAKSRVRDRFPAMSGFAVSDATKTSFE